MFKLDNDQLAKLDEWLDVQYAKLVAAQEKDPETAKFIVTVDERKHPYLGAIGGGITYQFTPTGLGTVAKVFFCKGSVHEASIDLTPYEDW